jgi:predicted dinucleotide-binding enzyme
VDIGIIGTGSVGSSLATGFADAGYRVMLGSRDPSQPRLAAWAADDPEHRRIGSSREAAIFGELVIFAIPGRALGEILDAIGRDAFAGKLVVDATNPIAVTETGEVVDYYGEDDSGAEFLQRELPDSAVVKAFNQIMAADMLHPERSSMTVLRIAGDDPAANRRFSAIAESFGWEVRDVGPLDKARALEHGVVEWMQRTRD